MGEITLQAILIFLLAGLFGFVVAWLLRARLLSRRMADCKRAEAAAQRTCDDLKRAAAALEGRLATLDAERRAADATHSALVGRLRLELAASRQAKTELLGALEADVRAAKQAYDQRLVVLTAELQKARGAAGSVQPPDRDLDPPSPPAAELKADPSDDRRPLPLPQPEGKPDDLKKIHGVGPKLERNLNDLGIFHYRQVAGLTAENVAWIDRYLKVRGRIERQNWVAQARVLASWSSPGESAGASQDEQV